MLGAAIIVVLLVLAALHLYWGLGGKWPASDRGSLAQIVVGTRNRPMPGFLPSFAVALALTAAAAIVFVSQGAIAPGLHALIAYGGNAALIAVFAARGVAPYVTPVFNYARGTPFFSLNLRYYAPLCLLIALGLVLDYPPGLDRALNF